MKNLSDFKKRLKTGIRLHTLNHRYGDMGIREVSIVQTNSFALKTIRDDKEIDSWSLFPSAKNFKIETQNSVTFFEEVEGQSEPILTYTFVD